MKFARIIVLFFLLTAALSGCLGESRPSGIVAQVNGRPITLRMVEARHDAEGGMVVIAQNPSVDLLQQQYGAILAELIVQELAAQELEQMGLGVTDEDVDRAMAEVRNDYPGMNFDEVLSEAHADAKTWRALLRYTVVMPRFKAQALRPKIKLSADEVEKYYLEHMAEFFVPAKLSLLSLTSSSQKSLAEARERILSGSIIVWRELPDVQSQRVEVRLSLLPEVWQEELSKLAEGKATKIREADGVFQCLVLEKRNPARRMGPVEAYPRIEHELVEQKMVELFAEWLEAAVAGARITVASQLRQREKSSTAPAVQRDEPRDSEPIQDSKGENGFAPGTNGARNGLKAVPGTPSSASPSGTPNSDPPSGSSSPASTLSAEPADPAPADSGNGQKNGQ